MRNALINARSRMPVLAVILVVVVLAGLVGRAVGSSEPGLTVVAKFRDASPLLEGNDIRMGGVQVGTIGKMTVVPGGADVELKLDRTALPVHRDASIVIRPVSLLGERYVELNPGTPSAPDMAEGGRISIDRTRSSTDLDQVLNAVDQPTGKALAALVTALGSGLAGNGLKTQDALKALAPALTNTTALASVLHDQNDVLNHLVSSLEGVTSGLATDEGAALDRVVTSTQEVLSVTAARQLALREVIQQLPATLRTARKTLDGLEKTSRATTPTLTALRPTTDNLARISTELSDFTDAAQPALRAVNPVLARADELVDKARPVASLLRQSGPALSSDARSLDPLSRDLTANIRPVFEFVKGWALTTNGRDGLSHYFRANLVLTAGMVTGQLPGKNKDPLATLPGGIKIPGLGGLLPNLGLPALPLIPGSGTQAPLLGGLLSKRTTSDGGVTGMSKAQELNALSFLLGGS